jgi:hypothetical protein
LEQRNNMGHGGKGDRQRPTDLKAFSTNYDAIFRKKDMQVRVKEDESKIGQCGCGRSPTGKCIGWHGLTEDQFKAALEKYVAEDKTNG